MAGAYSTFALLLMKSCAQGNLYINWFKVGVCPNNVQKNFRK